MVVVEVSIELPCNAEKAFDKWVEVVWRQGGGMGSVKTLDEGDANLVGNLRQYVCPVRVLVIVSGSRLASAKRF